MKNYDIKISDDDENYYYIKLNKINENILLDIIIMLNININIIQLNIDNVNITRTSEGGPFKRKYLNISIENGIEILDDNSSHHRIEHDPIHPDAIRDGVDQGLVVYPNIDLIREYHDLTEAIKIYNSIVEYINKNYEHIIIEKINISSYDEIVNRINTMKMNEFILKYVIENKFK